MNLNTRPKKMTNANVFDFWSFFWAGVGTTLLREVSNAAVPPIPPRSNYVDDRDPRRRRGHDRRDREGDRRNQRGHHWEIDYRKIIGICRNFGGELQHSYFTTVSEVFLELQVL